MHVTRRTLVAVVAGIAGCDVLLIRRGHPPLSSYVRRSAGWRLFIVVLALHLLAEVPGDPFTWLGKRLGAR